ncbi:Fe2+-dependent dioxygenase [Pusillimonas sp.]|uniref:Fe2+-dependent dioxygenase n=1 Tax=Pusillimonas sp. TaxID=3040095 RepID=UPI0029A67790|nr:Fe2+-dependent dioxygenase [Pusillimonas sp.]MDX3893974.1 Fe2+-dependent dioxygenase [Pusillimonas sp.]
MLITIPDVLDANQLALCRRLLQEAQWEDGSQTAGYIAQRAKQNRQLALNDPIATRLGDLILGELGRNQSFIAAALPAKILAPRFNRYENSGHYGNHIDNAVFVAPGTAQRVRSDVSCTLFLSDPGDYEGGELTIEDTYGTRQIKLPAGHMVVYPGTSLHHVTPVTRGVRVASFFWVQSMVRYAHQRAILWELDQSIQEIAMQTDDPSRLARLSGVYHNLIREWADT